MHTKVADTIESLQARVAELEAAYVARGKENLAVHKMYRDVESERDALRADAEKLRFELRCVLDWAQTERKPLRKQEIDSIKAALAAREPT